MSDRIYWRKVTKEQQKMVLLKYQQNADGAKNYREFRKRFRNHGEYIGGPWSGMFLGIEKDGHAHT